MGLARAINEHLTPGTEIFVAEMGTYGKGEIAELCEFVPPDLAAITSIGPVHLERFGSEEAIVDAKREILANARVAVLNVDHPLLARVGRPGRGRHRKVIRASGSEVERRSVGGRWSPEGRRAADRPGRSRGVRLQPGHRGSGCRRTTGFPTKTSPNVWPPCRSHLIDASKPASELGFVIIDDTYNSNPAGAAAALELLWSIAGGGTPGRRHPGNGRARRPPVRREPALWPGRWRRAPPTSWWSASPIAVHWSREPGAVRRDGYRSVLTTGSSRMGPLPAGTGRCRPLRERFARPLPVTVRAPRRLAVMTTPAVVFGGPSDEHDISILTGLQVSHALKDVRVFYWSKGGEWFQVDPDAEASDFVDGPPRKAKAVTLVPEMGKGFVGKKPIPVSAVINACHGGPGEDGTLQGIFDLAGIRYTGPGQAASALGMDKFAFGAAMAATGLPTLPRALVGFPRPGASAVSRPLHRQAAVWGFIDRDRSRR